MLEFMSRKVYIVDNGISDVKAITMTQLAEKSKGTPVIEAVTSADKTFITLRTDIVEGRILAGAKLSEAELSTKYGVSRAVIREAISRLMACHLVERKANVGARVVTLSPEGLIELYQVRESLEGMAARLAAQNMTSEQVTDLQSLLDVHAQGVKDSQSYYHQVATRRN